MSEDIQIGLKITVLWQPPEQGLLSSLEVQPPFLGAAVEVFSTSKVNGSYFLDIDLVLLRVTVWCRRRGGLLSV